MDFLELALRMFPFWLLGLFMIFLTIKTGNKDILRVDFQSIKKWAFFLIGLTIYRAAYLWYFWKTASVQNSVETVSWLPWQTTLTVFWEDAAHALPLILLMRLIGTKKWTWPIHAIAMIIIAAAFGSGHMYQGIMAVILLSFYVPLTIKTAKIRGLGTIMICHVLYDLSTILLIKYMMRVM